MAEDVEESLEKIKQEIKDKGGRPREGGTYKLGNKSRQLPIFIRNIFMKILKTFLFSLVLFYLSNILIWFSYNRGEMIKSYEKLSSSEALKNSGLSNDQLYNSMVGNIDSGIFNPGFNLGFGFGNKYQLIPILIIFSLYILYLILKGRSKKKM